MRGIAYRLGVLAAAGALLLSAACAAAEPIARDLLRSGEEAPPSGSVAPAPEGRLTPQLVSPAAEGSGTAQYDSSRAGATGASGDTGAPAANVTDRMIVYTTQISLEVESVPGAVAAVTGLAEGLGGYVSQNTLKVQDDKDFATIVIRVPAQAYNQAMGQLRKLGVKVTSENGSTRDVTEEFTDLGAQVKNLEATEQQLQALMAQARTVDEILKVQAQLTQVRGQIERLRGRMNLLQRTADMATITVNLTPYVPGKPDSPQGWDPLRSIQESWEASTRALVVVLDAGLRLAVMSWWVVLLGLGAWTGVVAWRRGRAKPPVPAGGPAS